MKNNNYWLTLYPFTYFNITKTKSIIYNTLTGNSEIFNNDDRIINIYKKLYNKENAGVIAIKAKDLEAPDVKRFIKIIRKLFAGDILPSHIGKKPIQITPYLKIQSEIVRDQKKIGADNPFADELNSHLNELTIHLNETECFFSNEIYIPFQTDYIFQRQKINNKKTQLSISDLGKILNIDMNQLRIVCSLKEYNHKSKLLEIIHKSTKNIYLYSRIGDIDLLDINSFKKRKVILQWDNVNRYWNNSNIKKVKNENILETQFLIRSVDEYNYIKTQINAIKLKRYSIYPYFDGENYDFFQKNIALTNEDILSKKQEMINILLKQSLNLNYYGKLTITCNGDIYSNLNKKKIGNYFKHSINQSILFELENSHGWKNTREYLKPCNQCIFQFLCPSPSNYEHIMKKNDLCYNFVGNIN